MQMLCFRKIEINKYYQTFVLLGYRRNLFRKVKVIIIFLLMRPVQHCAVQCSLVHYISAHCSVILCSIVQFRVAIAAQCNSVHFWFSVMKWFLCQCYFPHKLRDSVPPLRGFLLLEISFMKQHICCGKKDDDLFDLFYLQIYFIY